MAASEHRAPGVLAAQSPRGGVTRTSPAEGYHPADVAVDFEDFEDFEGVHPHATSSHLAQALEAREAYIVVVSRCT